MAVVLTSLHAACAAGNMLASMAKVLLVGAATAGLTAAGMHITPQRSRR
jgi:hypothetical protein